MNTGLALQAINDVGAAAKNYGVWFVVAVFLGLAIWRIFLPRDEKYQKQIAEQNQAIVNMLQAQLEESRQTRAAEIANLVQGMREIATGHAAGLKELSDSINERLMRDREGR